jgi:hypothetical protein
LRRLELDAKQRHEPFIASFAGLEMAGFHTYGESWLGHINQTLTGLWFKSSGCAFGALVRVARHDVCWRAPAAPNEPASQGKQRPSYAGAP